MIRVSRWTATALTATFLLLALLLAATKVVQAEPTAEKKAASPSALSAPSDRPSPAKSSEGGHANQNVKFENDIGWIWHADQFIVIRNRFK